METGDDIEPGQLQFIVDNDIKLRVLDDFDAEELFALTDKNRIYLREWLPWVDSTQTVEDMRAFIRSVQRQFKDGNGFACGIWYRGQLVGTIGLHAIDWANRKVEIGYWLAALFQRKGFMTKACRMLVSYAFDELNLNKVEIRCATGNKHSCAIPQRLGFTQEGIIRQGEWLYDHYVDLVLYSMLASEWKKYVTFDAKAARDVCISCCFCIKSNVCATCPYSIRTSQV